MVTKLGSEIAKGGIDNWEAQITKEMFDIIAHVKCRTSGYVIWRDKSPANSDDFYTIYLGFSLNIPLIHLHVYVIRTCKYIPKLPSVNYTEPL